MPNKQAKHFDVLIVGGGIIGMLTARSLHKKGLQIAIIDKGNLGGEATWAAGGILSLLNPWQQNIESQSLIDEGRQRFATLVTELKLETDIDSEFIQSGLLVLDVDQKQQALNWAKQKDETIEVLSHQSLLEYEPNISPEFSEALYFPNVAQIRPPKLIHALKLSLKQRKINVYENTAVSKVLIQAGSVTGIATHTDYLYADKVIISSGAWTKEILQQDTNIDIDIEPVRGQMLLYKVSEKILSHIVLKEKSYLIPRKDGHILCGSTVEYAGFENEVTSAARLSLQNIAHKLLPSLEKHEPVKQWSGLRPGTRRNAPYICKHPEIHGLYLNSGHYRYGIIMSIASARIMAELVVNTQNTSQITAFT